MTGRKIVVKTQTEIEINAFIYFYYIHNYMHESGTYRVIFCLEGSVGKHTKQFYYDDSFYESPQTKAQEIVMKSTKQHDSKLKEIISVDYIRNVAAQQGVLNAYK